jgi:hypothetical protein
VSAEFASSIANGFDTLPAKTLPSAHRLTLIALAYHADEKHRAAPSLADLMRLTTYCERTMKGILAELESAGWIEVESSDCPTDTKRWIVKQTGGVVVRRRAGKL